MMMRIIAGKWRRRLIKIPDFEITRPTSDRMRETIFNVLNSHLLKNNRSIQDMNVADLFAGSGAMGFEALSRGAAYVTFIEQNYQASQIIRQNIQYLQAESQSKLINADIFALKTPSICYDLVFLDPPYEQGLIQPILMRLKAQEWINSQSLIVIEAKVTDKIIISDDWEIKDYRTSGIKALWLISLKKILNL